MSNVLTDEEIQSVYSEFLDVKGSAMEFARRIERAVLAKAMDQEPVGRVSAVFNQGAGHFFNCEWLDHCNFKEGDLLYAHPLPAQAIPEGWRLTGFGQIKAGDVISLVMAGRRICTSAKEVLNAGTRKEEIVYNRKKNHYFITSMVLDGTSNHKDVFIIPTDSLSASPKT